MLATLQKKIEAIKKLLLIFVIMLTVIVGKGQSSVYHPFPDSNAVWRVDASFACPVNYLYWAHSYYQYTMGTDTTIGLYTYKKIYQSGLFAYCTNNSDVFSSTYDYYYKGALRQDSVNKKVYFKCPNYPDTLIYDFSKQVGDTFQLVTCYYGGSPFAYTVIVQSIDSVLVGNCYHKQFHYYGDYYSIAYNIIEGIGATSGLLEPIYDESMTDTWNLNCYSYNTDIYPSSSTSCPLITSISELKPINYQAMISPNPATNKLNVEVMQKSELQILNIQGQILMQQQIQQGKNDIDISRLAKGIYILRVCSNDRTEVVRIVKE